MIETAIGATIIIVATTLLIIFDWHSYGNKIKEESRELRRLDRSRIQQRLDNQNNLRDTSRARHPAGKRRMPIPDPNQHEREN